MGPDNESLLRAGQSRHARGVSLANQRRMASHSRKVSTGLAMVLRAHSVDKRDSNARECIPSFLIYMRRRSRSDTVEVNSLATLYK